MNKPEVGKRVRVWPIINSRKKESSISSYVLQEDPRDYATVFIEGTLGQYNTYLSQKYAHLGWYIGIKKNGTIKHGPLTRWGQKAIQFLPVRSD